MSPFLSLSIVVPVYSGQAFLSGLVARQEALRAQLENSEWPIRHVESIFVCDEPIDGSAKLLQELAATRPWLTVLHLGKNMGQHGATAAGMLHTSGDWVVTMDEDGQHDPLAITELLEATLPRGLDLCYARPISPVHASWRDGASKTAKRLVAFLVGDPFVPLFNSFRLIRGGVARSAGALAGYDVYLDVALRWFTSRVGTVELTLKDPRGGEQRSGYTLRSLFGHLRRLLMSYHLTVLRYVMLAGFTTSAGFGLLGLGLLVMKLINPDIVPVQGWTSIFVTTSFFGGLTLFLLGLILERLSTMLTRAQGHPAFFIVDRSRDALWTSKKSVRTLPDQVTA
jgi:polyisoprenyl-phosphate glycosyltransferase